MPPGASLGKKGEDREDEREDKREEEVHEVPIEMDTR